jgi:hypothetical protein
MDCGSCVTSTAREAAKVCPSLQGKAIGQMFVLLYPNPACSNMHQRFADEYRKAPGDLEEELIVERRPMGRLRTRSRTAVA